MGRLAARCGCGTCTPRLAACAYSVTLTSPPTRPPSSISSRTSRLLVDTRRGRHPRPSGPTSTQVRIYIYIYIYIFFFQRLFGWIHNMSPCYCSSCDKSLRLPLARVFKQTVQTEMLAFAVAVTPDTSPRPTIRTHIFDQVFHLYGILRMYSLSVLS